MKKTLLFSLLVALTLVAASSRVEAKEEKKASSNGKLKVFILAGQSNMQGFGFVSEGAEVWSSPAPGSTPDRSTQPILQAEKSCCRRRLPAVLSACIQPTVHRYCRIRAPKAAKTIFTRPMSRPYRPRAHRCEWSFSVRRWRRPRVCGAFTLRSPGAFRAWDFACSHSARRWCGASRASFAPWARGAWNWWSRGWVTNPNADCDGICLSSIRRCPLDACYPLKNKKH